MSWPSVKLGGVCRVIPGFAFKSADFTTQGIPVVKIANITDHYTVDLTEAEHWPNELFNEKLSKFLLQDRDILLAMTGATAGKLGRVRTDQALLLNQRVAKIQPFEADPDFMWFLLSSPKYRERFYNLAGGAAQPNMSGGQIEAVEIPLPPGPVQERIGSILSGYDDLIENNRRRMALLEEAARHLYREWFVRLRFPGHEHTRITNGVPEGWQRVPTPEAVDINPRTHLSDEAEHWSVEMADLPTNSMVIQQANKREGRSGSKFRNGDTLFARITPCLENGKTAFVDFMDEGEVARGSTEFIVLRSRRLTPEFVYCLARTYDFRENAIKSMVGSSGRQRVQEGCFDKFLVLAPPSTLLSLFTDSVRPVFQQIKVLHAQDRKLRAARDLLLPRLMSGEIAV